jgi:hypothetical protein
MAKPGPKLLGKLGLKLGTKRKQIEAITIDNNAGNSNASELVLVPKQRGKPGPKPGLKPLPPATPCLCPYAGPTVLS